MSWLSAVDWVGWVSSVNVVLASGIVVLSFAFLVYVLIYNIRSGAARSFATLLTAVLIVYFVDLAVVDASLATAMRWLRFQWVGIAMTPAAYLHIGDALLRMTNDRSRVRGVAVRVAYGVGGGVLLAAAFTDLLVRDGLQEAGAVHLRAGPYFWFFVLCFAVAVGWGGLSVVKAWRRCLTSTSRRRMTYLALAFVAPAVGVFPYLLITGWPQELPSVVLWLLLVLGNLAVGLMLLMMTYSVAFFGVLTPDRVVKHRFVRFFLRGPVQATVVVMVIIAASRADGFLGLPALRLSLFGAVIAVLFVQLGVELAKPIVDRMLYRRDQAEIAWLQSLGDRLLTTSDLYQFLENVLTAMCDLLRTSAAFVAVIEDGQARMEAVAGSLELGHEALPQDALGVIAEGTMPNLHRSGEFFVWDGYWLLPLRTRHGDTVIGVLGLVARAAEPNLSRQEEEVLGALADQVVAALEDRLIQQGLFSALERMIPQIAEIQRRSGLLRYEGAAALSGLRDPASDAEFPRWVRDALSHYWGGPKLTRSPLLELRIVERASEQVGSRVSALQTVLRKAIERMRPEGDRSLTAAEWLLYNILELKFLKGYRVRDVALRLAMSESDLYRKQRIAIEEVAQVLEEMEREERIGS